MQTADYHHHISQRSPFNSVPSQPHPLAGFGTRKQFYEIFFWGLFWILSRRSSRWWSSWRNWEPSGIWGCSPPPSARTLRSICAKIFVSLKIFYKNITRIVSPNTSWSCWWWRPRRGPCWSWAERRGWRPERPSSSRGTGTTPAWALSYGCTEIL